MSGGDAIVITLSSVAGVNNWTCTCTGTDDLTSPPAITLNNTNKTASFTAPAGPFALIFQSQVNGGKDVNQTLQPSYTTTFGIYALASGNRLFATNERFEGSALYGWITKFNAFIRSGGGGGAGNPTIGSLTSGGDVNQTLTRTSANMIFPISALTAARTFTMYTSPTVGDVVGIMDSRKLYTASNQITLTTAGGTDNFYMNGTLSTTNSGHSLLVPASLFAGNLITLTRASSTTWEVWQ